MGKRLNKKATVNFKIYDVTNRETNNPKEIRSVNRIKREMSFFQKSCKKEAGRLVPDLFLFFKQALYEVKASGLHLSFNILHP